MPTLLTKFIFSFEWPSYTIQETSPLLLDSCNGHNHQTSDDWAHLFLQIRQKCKQTKATSLCLWMTRWVAFISVGVGKCQSEDYFVLLQNPHKWLVHEISHLTGRGRRKEGPRVKRRSQSSEGGRTAGDNRRLLGPVDSEAGLANVRGWVSVPGGFVGISLE